MLARTSSTLHPPSPPTVHLCDWIFDVSDTQGLRSFVKGSITAPFLASKHGSSQVFIQRVISTFKHNLTLTVLVATIDAQWEGVGDVGPSRYEPALLPPCPTIRVLSCSN